MVFTDNTNFNDIKETFKNASEDYYEDVGEYERPSKFFNHKIIKEFAFGTIFYTIPKADLDYYDIQYVFDNFKTEFIDFIIDKLEKPAIPDYSSIKIEELETCFIITIDWEEKINLY